MIKHLDGICHVFVDKDADISIAEKVVFNSKMRRPGICGAAETLLIHKKKSDDALKIIEKLVEAGCEIRGDVFIQSLSSKFGQATDEDWSTEYLEKIISVKIVEDVDEAINHINTFGSGHTESIITNNSETFDTFQKKN